MMRVAQRLNTIEEYYFSRKLREVREMIAKGKPVINMGIGSPDLAPHSEVISAMQKAALEPMAHQYQSYQGLPELRVAMAQFYKEHFAVSLEADTEILPLMGSKEGIMHISMAFLNKGDKVLVPNPGYPTYTSVTRLVEAEPIFYDLKSENNWFPDLNSLEKEDLTNVKMMWLSYPHMPTGAKATKEDFERLLAFARRHKILLINDNPYSFVLNDEQLSLLQMAGKNDDVLELNSLSKTFNMAGWRIGMIVGKANLIDAVLKVKSNMDSGMFYPLQRGAIVALRSSNHWFQELNEVYDKRRKAIYKLAEKLGCTYDTNAIGLFVWAKLPLGITSAEKFIDNLLVEKYVFLTPGTIFGSNGEGYIRFSLCVSEEKIMEALSRFN
ncbi:pyridoxal phosphate-dependent aminotransferase [Imtechella halotolerans]|nr:aminotransferase class I/II-fold pyridoxal phosphate-dependent enzyme [Imtechella halotolerans]WMQ64753.1 aminotransferase class I/II-fold pyridoxal phosphate-dependent enzyme [Imtechella halotolerans]